MTEKIFLPAPTASDTTELHFKLVSRIKAISYNEKFTCANLLAVSSSFGLVFIATVDGFIVARTKDIVDNPFPQKHINVRCKPVTNLAVNSNESYLIVGGNVPSKGCVAYLYLIQNNLVGTQKLELSSTPGVVICDLLWNPALPQLVSACLSDGSVVVVEFKEKSFELNSLPPAAAARCLCWSPKGKQIVVGGEDGRLTQYKPDLKPAKVLPPPDLFEGVVAVVNILWVSNFQFAAFYRHRTDHNVCPVLVIVNANKNEPVAFINYDDVTYGSTSFRFPQFYFHHIQAWNMILISSANSVELAIMQLSDDGKNWQHRMVGDSSRVEMPLSDTQDETYPLGMALDFTSQSPIPWPQTESQLPPMPRLLFITNEGKLCIYNVINLRPDIPQLCAPPSGQYPDSFFTLPTLPIEEKPVVAVSPVAPPKQEQKPIAGAVPFVAAVPPPQTPLTLSFASPAPPEQQTFGGTLASSHAEVVKPQELPKPNPPTTTLEKPVSPLSPVVETEVDDAVYSVAISEEVAALNEIFDVFKIEMSSNNIELMPEEDFSSVVKSLDCLVDFEKDVEETINSQAEEISELKFDVLELTAKVEDSRLVSNRRNSKLNNQLRRSEQLDPVMARTLREILALKTFIENQLSQVNDHLDRQWEDYQRSCRKNAKDSLEIPMMEDIFKTLNIQKKLISVKRAQLDALQKEIEQRSFLGSWQANVVQPSLRSSESNRSVELSKLADSLLGMSIQTSDKIDKDAIKNLTVESIRLSLMADEISIADLTLLLDRFEDAEVPQVSHALSYAEREAHKKEVAQRIKNTSERIKAKKNEEILKKQTINEKEYKKISETPKMNVQPTNIIFQSSSESVTKVGSVPKFPSSKTAMPVTITEKPQPEPILKDKPQTVTWSSKPEASNSSKPTDVPVLTGLLTKTTPIIKVPEGTTVQKVKPVPETIQKPVTPPSSTGFTGFGTVKFSATSSTPFVPTAPNPSLFGTPKTSLLGNVSTTPFSFGDMSTPIFGTPKSTTNTSTSPAPVTVSKLTAASPSTKTDDSLKTTSTEKVVTTPKVEFSFGAAIEAQTSDKQHTLSQENKTETKMKGLFGSSGNVTPQVVSQPVAPVIAEVTKSAIPATVNTQVPPPIIPVESTKASTQSATPPQSAQITSTSNIPKAVSTAAPSSISSFGLLSTSPAATTESLFSTKPPTTGSMFGSFSTSPLASKTTSLFGSNSGVGMFGATSTSGAVFGATPTASSATPPAETSSEGSTETTSASLFSKPVTTAVASPFGSTTSSTPSAFGTSAPLFGSLPTTTTSTGLFSATTSAVNTDIFSKPLFSTPSTTTAASLFGSTFGQATTATSGLFGASTTPTTAASGLFGSSTTPTTPSTFGGDLNQATNLFGKLLEGSPAAQPTTGLFGQETPTKTGFDSGSNIFSSTPSNTASSIFGSSSPSSYGQAQSGSLFGGTTNASNIFAQTPATTSSTFFGQNICSPFVSGAPAPNQSPFGAPAAANQNVFASSASAPVFGQSTFGQSQTSSIFGGSSGGTVVSSGSIFGGNTSGGFQSSFSGGSFSGGNSSVAQSGFGAPAAFSKPAVGGFGSAPIFGGTAAPATFGGTPAFGSTSPFGSPTKVFGSTSPQAPVFGQAAGNTGFENLGNQSSLGFGNIAQQGFGSTGFGTPQQSTFGNQPQQQQQSSSFGSSSFSSWR